jgi:hypothetical protein
LVDLIGMGAEYFLIDHARPANFGHRGQDRARIAGVGDSGDSSGKAVLDSAPGRVPVVGRTPSGFELSEGPDPERELVLIDQSLEPGQLEVSVEVDQAREQHGPGMISPGRSRRRRYRVLGTDRDDSTVGSDQHGAPMDGRAGQGQNPVGRETDGE